MWCRRWWRRIVGMRDSCSRVIHRWKKVRIVMYHPQIIKHTHTSYITGKQPLTHTSCHREDPTQKHHGCTHTISQTHWGPNRPFDPPCSRWGLHGRRHMMGCSCDEMGSVSEDDIECISDGMKEMWPPKQEDRWCSLTLSWCLVDKSDLYTWLSTRLS